jgi:hypothetical protein
VNTANGCSIAFHLLPMYTPSQVAGSQHGQGSHWLIDPTGLSVLIESIDIDQQADARDIIGDNK